MCQPGLTVKTLIQPEEARESSAVFGSAQSWLGGNSREHMGSILASDYANRRRGKRDR